MKSLQIFLLIGGNMAELYNQRVMPIDLPREVPEIFGNYQMDFTRYETENRLRVDYLKFKFWICSNR